MKIWGYIGIVVALIAAYAVINSSFYDKIVYSLKTRPEAEEVTIIVDNEEFVQNQMLEMYVDSVQDRFAHQLGIDYPQIDILTRPDTAAPKFEVLLIPEGDSVIQVKKEDRPTVVKKDRPIVVKVDVPVVKEEKPVVVKEEPAEKLIEIVSWQIPENYGEILIETLTEEGWDDSYLKRLSKYLQNPNAKFQANVLDRNITHQETNEQYNQHLTKQSVDMCMEFWKSYGEEVTAAISSYDIPPGVIVAILKVESNFGTHRGRQAVFNVFCSLSIADNPEIMNNLITSEGAVAKQQRARLQKRAKWGRSQLHELLNLVIDLSNEELLWEVSSWAGAFGLPQFIPTSFRAYARDGNNDGIIELNNISDAAISIANYLKSNGWKSESSIIQKRKVIMRYNNSIHYAECILNLADSIKWRIREGE